MVTKDFRNAGLIGIICGLFLSSAAISGTYLSGIFGTNPLQQEVIKLTYFYINIFGYASMGFALLAFFKAFKPLFKKDNDAIRGLIVGFSASFGLSNEIFASYLPQIIHNILTFFQMIDT